ncbi:cytidine deaminase [Treponema sp. OMZ 840]|uniref:cytidine deaminase n=1 Tax=Treponema sp. OMZ 840 TaxID=244313 RepID=UPI003D948740
MKSDAEMVKIALKAREKAYVPYSHFKVGAALETKDGRVYEGCNIENASYGLTNCAERTAFFAALADGCRPGDFVKLAVVGQTEDVISPCGACRQVISELGENCEIVLANLDGKMQKTDIRKLLPGAFGAADL